MSKMRLGEALAVYVYLRRPGNVKMSPDENKALEEADKIVAHFAQIGIKMVEDIK